MRILSVEQSTVTGSIALLNDDSVVAEKSWNEEHCRNRLFAVLPEFLEQNDLNPACIDAFAVGLGPGAFSGIRITLAAVRSMALPGRRPVIGVSSAEAMSYDVFRRRHPEFVAVIGDARRHRLWFALFRTLEDLPVIDISFRLTKVEELHSLLRPDTILVTPDWQRIGKQLESANLSDVELVAGESAPKASVLGQLAFRKNKAGRQKEKLAPIYLHPPVFVNPRF